MARIWRDGQARPCAVYRLLTTGALDEKMYQRQLMKALAPLALSWSMFVQATPALGKSIMLQTPE